VRASLGRSKELGASPPAMGSSGEFMRLTKVETQMQNLKHTVARGPQ
jgi:hypothetical protein